VYIAGIIITTATITVIGATITAITAIGETYHRVAAVIKLARHDANSECTKNESESRSCATNRKGNKMERA
jgi:hypothetical protein